MESSKKIVSGVAPIKKTVEERRPMKIVKFWRHGGGLAIPLPKFLRDALGWPSDAEIWIVADLPRKRLIIEPVKKGG